jgi:hypothetical protein
MADSMRCDVGQVLTIDELPDDVLLKIFDFYVDPGYQDAYFSVLTSNKDTLESWQLLVHACRRWRGLVFESSRRLNLQLLFITGTSAGKTLDVWPAFPLLIRAHVVETSVDNVIAVLEHSDRIRQIDLGCHSTFQIEKLRAAMQVPFPELTALYFQYGPLLPDLFLGGSAPRLRSLALTCTPFPGLPKLLLSATHLVYLGLLGIPHSGYFSPEAMATCLSMLTSLNTLQLEFESPQSSPDQGSRRPPPLTRFVLPALMGFSFKGVNEYLEDLLSRIDTPYLYSLETNFFNDIDFDTPELIRFVSRSSTLNTPDEAHVFFGSRTASVKLQQQASNIDYFEVKISCRVPNWQLSSLAQICTSSLPLLSATESLFICKPIHTQPDWEDGIESTEWLELLLPFTVVKNLHLSKQFAPRIAPALQEITRGRTEVLPTLQNLFLEGFQPSGPVDEAIGQFISARNLTNRPVAISVWERDSEQGSQTSSEARD